MNTKPIVSIGVVTMTCVALSLFADETTREEQTTRDAAQSHIIQRSSRAYIPAKASQILGREITDGNGHRIGKVRDLALDLQNGRIVEVVVAIGGFWGIKEKDTAVPPGEFSWDPATKKLVCRLDQEQLRYAPAFDVSQWPDSTTPERIREIYHRYNVAPYFIDEKVQAPLKTEVKPASQLTSALLSAPTAHLGPILRARNILGALVQNPQDERLGKVENIIVDMGASRIVVLIVSTGGFLDMGNEVSAIPAQAFRYTSNPVALHLNTTREALWTKPHFTTDQWPGVANDKRITSVYIAYDIPPYRDANNTAQNVRERSGDTLTPFDQGTSPADRALTARIRREIMVREDLSIDAQNVKIITINGQVTLRGPVQNLTEEQTIIQIARNAVTQDAKVTNQIQTISPPPKNNSILPPNSSN